MNSRRSKSVKLVSSHSQSIEVELGESSPMSSSIDNTVYCCVAKGNKILYSFNSKGCELETLAILCLENAPAFHRWYFHSVGTRTFGLLMVDGHTYFAIVDPSVGNLAILRFLEHIKDGFKKVVKNGFHENELVPIIQRLIASLDNMPKSAFSLDDNSEGTASGDGSTSSKAPLLGKSSGKHQKKMKDKVVQSDDVVEDHADRAVKVKVDVPPQTTGAMSLQRSSSSTRLRLQQPGRRLWSHHVKIVIAVDVILCLVLFGIWLAVCKGFRCVS